jgi:hypothetical protein
MIREAGKRTTVGIIRFAPIPAKRSFGEEITAPIFPIEMEAFTRRIQSRIIEEERLALLPLKLITPSEKSLSFNPGPGKKAARTKLATSRKTNRFWMNSEALPRSFLKSVMRPETL